MISVRQFVIEFIAKIKNPVEKYIDDMKAVI